MVCLDSGRPLPNDCVSSVWVFKSLQFLGDPVRGPAIRYG